ncbi:MAG: hypothetical protein IPO64_03540 [Bacteroidetes bacterium]|nr:hypothetical protein [Bacteroidota bacterium]
MRNIILSLFFLLSISFKGKAQILPADIPRIEQYKDTLLILMDTMGNSPFAERRLGSAYGTIKYLKTALKIPKSFYYDFGEIPGLSIIKSPDQKFRIFTWQAELVDGSHRNFGVIQMRSDTLLYFPLVDYGDLYDAPSMQVVDNERWIGAFYYNLLEKKIKKKSYYFLFGWDGADTLVNNKIVDVLWFKDGEMPRFGAPFFEKDADNPMMRLFLPYKDDAQVGLNYNVETKRIEYDHLESLFGLPENVGSDKIPDGTYEGFIWKKGKWRYIEALEYQKLQDGEFPMMDR